MMKTSPMKMPAQQPMENARPVSFFKTYRPLILVFAFITFASLVPSFRSGEFSASEWMLDFMGAFFLGFSFFKLLNLKEFANAYRMYDIVAAKIPSYGYLYPLIELALGAAFVLRISIKATSAIALVVMAVSTVGVLKSVLSKKEIKCACLGTVFNLPMSTITLFEDLLMVAMSLAMLLASGYSL